MDEEATLIEGLDVSGTDEPTDAMLGNAQPEEEEEIQA